VGHNFRRILAWLRELLCLFLARLRRTLACPVPLNSAS
jgi:IS5 family transposase